MDIDKTRSWAPLGLAALRIMTGLLFMQHGLQKMFHFPDAGHHPEPYQLLTLTGIGGVLETFGGAAVVIGLFTRPTAFLLCGEMAVAYFLFYFPAGLHMSNGVFPFINGGDLAVLFCFEFLYLSIAGAGVLSLDDYRARRSEHQARR